MIQCFCCMGRYACVFVLEGGCDRPDEGHWQGGTVYSIISFLNASKKTIGIHASSNRSNMIGFYSAYFFAFFLR